MAQIEILVDEDPVRLQARVNQELAHGHYTGIQYQVDGGKYSCLLSGPSMINIRGTQDRIGPEGIRSIDRNTALMLIERYDRKTACDELGLNETELTALLKTPKPKRKTP